MTLSKVTAETQAVTTVEAVARRIHTVRGLKVMLDSDLAAMYGVSTGNLNLAVRRNSERFPSDFVLQLSEREWEDLILQTAISNPSRGGRRFLPYVFTEQGVAMLSSVLRSPRAIQVNIAIMRAFVRLRQAAESHRELIDRLDELERKYSAHDEEIQVIFQAVKELLTPTDVQPRRRIGFPEHAG